MDPEGEGSKIARNIQWHISINAHRTACKVSVILLRFQCCPNVFWQSTLSNGPDDLNIPLINAINL